MAKISLVAVATTPDEQEQGLQFVRHLPTMSGMLFKFHSPRVLSFWMKNTYVPLDIAFLDQDGMIVKTESMTPLSLRSVSSGRPCVMALETTSGALEEAGLKVGRKALVDVEKMVVELDEDQG